LVNFKKGEEMKRILFLVMFFGLSHFAIAGEECSNDSGICSDDFTESNLDLDDNSAALEDSAEKANFYRCVSVNSRTRRWGVGFDRNYWKSALEAYNKCKANNWRWARFCQRPKCNRVHFPGPGPFPFPFPGGGGGGPGGGGPGGPGGGGPWPN
jgi:hypothetical protein